MRKLLSIVLSLTLLCTCFSGLVMAAEADLVENELIEQEVVADEAGVQEEALVEETEVSEEALDEESEAPLEEVENLEEELSAMLEKVETAIGSSNGEVSTSGEEEYVYFTTEKLTIGQGFVVEPRKVSFAELQGAYSGLNSLSEASIAHLTEYVLGDKSSEQGKDLEGYYLNSIKDGAAADSAIAVPSLIEKALDGEIGSRYEDNWLGSFDYTQYSGWMFTQNNAGIEYGADQCHLQPNDVIRLGFSIYGWGGDLFDSTEWGSSPLFEYANKDSLIKAVADINYEDNAADYGTAYTNAMTVLSSWEATQAEVDAALAALDGSVTPSEPAGSGTEDDPYLISTVADLDYVRSSVNDGTSSFEGQYLKLAADITLPEGWNPIGSSNSIRFKGTFDGDNHTVTVPKGGLPLFGFCQNATIKNLSIYGEEIAGYGLINNFSGIGLTSIITIDNVTLKSGTKTLKSGLLGAEITTNPFAGNSTSSTAVVKNCTVEEDCVIGYDGTQDMIGSLAGCFQGTMENCVSYATVKGGNFVGGIIAMRDNAMGTCIVKNCQFNGTVEGTQNVGGIVGGDYKNSTAPNGVKVSVIDCTASGTVTGTENVGGILGGDVYVAQAWNAYDFTGNTFNGKVSGSSNVGAVIGYYLSLNKFDNIAGNTYTADCGASKGIGAVKYIDTNVANPTAVDGTEYFNTENGTSGCPVVTGCGWRAAHNRTDDPLGVDAKNLCSVIGGDVTPVSYPTYENKVYDDFENDLWLQYDFKEMNIGDEAVIYPRRVPQAVTNVVTNDVDRPNFNFEIVEGDSITLSGTDSTESVTATAVKPGDTVVMVTYDAFTHKNNKEFAACSVVNTAYVVFSVKGENSADIEISTSIEANSYDTYYYVGENYPLSFTVNAPGAASLQVTCNGQALTDEAGTYTALLGNRSNILGVIATDSNGKTRSWYQVVDARKIEINVVNTRNHPDDVIYPGDTVQVSFRGITPPVYKLATIYNPAPPSMGKGTYVHYTNPAFGMVQSKTGQYDLATANTITLTAPSSSGSYLFSEGRIYSQWFGSKLGQDKGQFAPGAPNLNADQLEGEFSILPDFTLEVTAVDPQEVMSEGTCGDNASWVLTYGGTLTIGVSNPNSSGEITATTAKKYPWYEDRANIKKVVVQNGITNLPKQAFQNCASLTSVEIAASVASLGASVFAGTALTEVTIPNKGMEFGSKSIPAAAVIYGYTGSTAQTYAQANGNTFAALDVYAPELKVEDGQAKAVVEDLSGDLQNADYVLDLTSSGSEQINSVELKLNESALGQLAKADSVVIKTDLLQVEFDQSTLSGLTSSGNVTLTVEQTTSEQYPDALVYEINLTDEHGQKLLTGNGNGITLRIPYTGGDTNKDIYLLDNTGKLIKLNAAYEDGYFVAHLEHFSTYLLMDSQEVDNGFSVSAKANPAEVSGNSNFTVDLVVSSTSSANFASLQTSLSYDSNLVSYAGIDYLIPNSSGHSWQIADIPGRINLTLTGSSVALNSSGECAAARLTFVPNSANVGESSQASFTLTADTLVGTTAQVQESAAASVESATVNLHNLTVTFTSAGSQADMETAVAYVKYNEAGLFDSADYTSSFTEPTATALSGYVLKTDEQGNQLWTNNGTDEYTFAQIQEMSLTSSQTFAPVTKEQKVQGNIFFIADHGATEESSYYAAPEGYHLMVFTPDSSGNANYTYNEKAMFKAVNSYSGAEQEVFLYFVPDSIDTPELALAKMDISETLICQTISYDMDINLSGGISILDAQLAYDLYSEITDLESDSSFTLLGMRSRLEADVNKDASVNSTDVWAIQYQVLQQMLQ